MKRLPAVLRHGLGVLALLFCAASADGQTAPRAADPEVRAVLERLSFGEQVGFRMSHGAWRDGLLARVEADSVHFWTGEAIELAGVSTIWLRRGRPGAGALIGGGVGGLILAPLLVGVGCDALHTGFSCFKGALPLYLVVGVPLGAAAGAMVGLVWRRWHQEYP